MGRAPPFSGQPLRLRYSLDRPCEEDGNREAGIRAMAQDTEKKAPAKNGAIALVNRMAKNQDQVLEQVLRDFPELTREEAVAALKAEGFY